MREVFSVYEVVRIACQSRCWFVLEKPVLVVTSLCHGRKISVPQQTVVLRIWQEKKEEKIDL